MSNTLKVCSVQMDSKLGDVGYNIRQVHKLILEAKKQDIELVVLPELFDVGYDLDLIKTMAYDTECTLNELKHISSSTNIYIVAGVYECLNGEAFNTAYVIAPNGEILGKYRKNKLFCLSKEKEIFNPGTKLEMIEIKNIKFGLMICYDIRFPEIGRSYVAEGCEAIIVLSAFPFPRLEHWKILLRARAIENQMYIIAANRVGKDKEFWFHGKSCIIDPWGTILHEGNETDEGLIISTISKDEVIRVRKALPALDDR